jgi:hypothetical protein
MEYFDRLKLVEISLNISAEEELLHLQIHLKQQHFSLSYWNQTLDF